MTYTTQRVVASEAGLMGNRYKHFIIPLMNGWVGGGRWKRIEVSIRMIANRFYDDLKADNVHRIPRYNELRQIISNYTAFALHARKIKKIFKKLEFSCPAICRGIFFFFSERARAFVVRAAPILKFPAIFLIARSEK